MGRDQVEEANANPDLFARKTVGLVAGHVVAAIRGLDRKPVVIGHSFGGLLTDRRRSRACGRVGGDRPRAVPRRAAVELPNRGHALTIDSGWREVADTALAFVRRFA